MQYRPTASELLASMADLLEGELMPALPESLQHRARVAGNLARILEREERLAALSREREHELVADLLGHDAEIGDLRAELTAKLRAGADDDFERKAWDVLVTVARDDLAIAKPGHDSWEGQ